MPRVTPQHYLVRRHQLTDIWRSLIPDYSYLRSAEQRALHDYYRPPENLTEVEALKQRQDVSRSHLSLPQLAGRAFSKLIGIRAGTVPIPAPETVHVAAGHGISVLAVLRAEPDPDALARAILAMAKADLEAKLRERDKHQDV